MRKFSTFSHLSFRESSLGQLFWAPIFHSSHVWPTLELENCFLRRKFRLQPARAAISQNPDGGVRPTTWLLFSAAAAVWSMPRCQRLCCMSDAITIMTDKGNIHDSRKRGWGGFRRPKFEVLLQPLISTSNAIPIINELDVLSAARWRIIWTFFCLPRTSLKLHQGCRRLISWSWKVGGWAGKKLINDSLPNEDKERKFLGRSWNWITFCWTTFDENTFALLFRRPETFLHFLDSLFPTKALTLTNARSLYN